MDETSTGTAVPDEAASTLTVLESSALRERGIEAARSSAWLGNGKRSRRPVQIFRDVKNRIARAESEIDRLRQNESLSEDLRWFTDNLRLVHSDLSGLRDALRSFSKLPAVRTTDEENVPRDLVLARALAAGSGNKISEESLTVFIKGVDEVEPLRLAELGGFLTGLKLALLELLAAKLPPAITAFRNEGPQAVPLGIGHVIRSLRLLGERDWRTILEPLSLVHMIFLEDPARVYGRMDFQSRELYRQQIERVARYSDVNEFELARLTVKLARENQANDANTVLNERAHHVGYYLFDSVGSEKLFRRVRYRPRFDIATQRLFCKYPDEVYILGVELITLITVVALIMSIVRAQGGWGLVLGAILLLIPATQSAVEAVNYLVTAVLTPSPLPKLDFSEAVPPRAATMVAIPTLLINEKQIRQLVDDLEVRYLVNRDPNIFYALLTDLPDTAEPAGEQDNRVDLVTSLINELNNRYASEPFGGFYLFHRHRIYNPREGAWMGWERKRGKLLDLNQLLRQQYDPFPVKTGDLSKLPGIQYVLTLDSDTQLPRGSAQRLIGAMAHPLNRPVIDPETNIVTSGYGILQPRVGISVHSASQSRLAAIYSGQTGFDIYSRAVSDVYQDLYGEAIFTGKGIYDVDALRQVLERRFPHNALLSHDLIEGAYARAGLASDIEVIDDYPSHYSAYNRRRHRWLRGDWQIVRWIVNKVPDESGELVENPISLISRWKIFDNLRRSLVEPATFFLLLAGWFWLPGGPRFWTLVTLALLFLPIYLRLVFTTVRTVFSGLWNTFPETLSDFVNGHLSIALNIVFLAHQSLVSIDAIVRTVVRSFITHTRLLEWETATEAELGIRKRTPVDIYLDWVPLLAAIIAAGLYFARPAVPYALPFLVAWAASKLVSNWLNRPPSDDLDLSDSDVAFLREVALKTWRYFAEYSCDRNHWLIPDNVQEHPYRVAERLSPTNLGLLFNARQAAIEFGYLTLPEFVKLNEQSFATISRLQRYFGHFLNWYDNISLKPLEPAFISSVDSGNLVASLWSLKHGCLEILRQPLIEDNGLAGIADHLQMLGKTEPAYARLGEILTMRSPAVWLPALLELQLEVSTLPAPSGAKEHVSWLLELRRRIEALREIARLFMPWTLPEYVSVRALMPEVERPQLPLTPGNAAAFFAELDSRLHGLTADPNNSPEALHPVYVLRGELPECRNRLQQLAQQVRNLANECDRLVEEMDFTPLVNKSRNLLSVGYDVAAKSLNQSCYDLLASESRTATFAAVAKGDLVQEGWFRLGRQHTVCEGETTLLSWTGTMFEYLMPVIWMKSHPNTLLDRAVRGAVLAQRSYGESRHVPWGISEAAYRKTDSDGNYQYAAFGVPGLALSVPSTPSLIISPYSSCLAVMVEAAPALKNLIRMRRKKWLTEYGFYESIDYTDAPNRQFLARRGEVIRCWMAHHQGMSLASICNVLHDWAFQRWFHSERLVQASELILQEKPLRIRVSSAPGVRRRLRRTKASEGSAATTASGTG